MCSKPETPDNKLQVAHLIPFGVGVKLYKLTPDWLDQSHNLVWAHTKVCNKSAELRHDQIMDKINGLNEGRPS